MNERLAATAPVDIIVGPVARFLRLEAASGIVLLACTAAALAWANSPWAGAYTDLFHHRELTIGLGGVVLAGGSVEWWINDGLMAIFFFVVGLEIKRELAVGELSSVRKAALPLMAALGGMVVPALVFVSLGARGDASRGWGVPMATDIAFALGVLALLGRRVPASLRVFLAALAVADDLGALIVIAVFYSEEIRAGCLLAGIGTAGLMFILGALGVRRWAVYLGLGLVVWYLVLLSGVHATIAGVLAAFAVPVRSRVDAREFLIFSRRTLDDLDATGPCEGSIVTDSRQQSIVQSLEDACDRVQTPLQVFEHALTPWVAFLIVPLFALANAGVSLTGGVPQGEAMRVSGGVGLGLMLGKPAGILLATWVAVRLRLGELPRGVRWMHVVGVGCLGGIGFTMALFIAQLAYRTAPELLVSAKIGILAGSACSAVAGLVLLAAAAARPEGAR
ncbi:MAG: Na+/H+ antiporter NhaA [Phycisphaerales bacterium]|nr:Na+/H+ antiporter NhaA [Phycisphaerales bacterium]